MWPLVSDSISIAVSFHSTSLPLPTMFKYGMTYDLYTRMMGDPRHILITHVTHVTCFIPVTQFSPIKLKLYPKSLHTKKIKIKTIHFLQQNSVCLDPTIYPILDNFTQACLWFQRHWAYIEHTLGIS